MRCQVSQPFANFSVSQNRCRGCLSEMNRENYKAGTSRTRSYDGVFEANIRRQYGLTMARYEEMLIAQGGVCAICRGPETVLRRNGEPYRLAVDHSHATMRIRGLLCRRCNQLVWALDEHAGLLDSVNHYLGQSRESALSDAALDHGHVT